MVRYYDWPVRLERFLAENGARAFRYGSFDCCLFVCGAIKCMTGTDPAVSFRGRYHSAAQARSFGSVATIAATVSAEHRMPEISPLCAGRGDVVLIKRARDYSLALVALNGRDLLAVSRAGCARLPLSRGVRAWRV